MYSKLWPSQGRHQTCGPPRAEGRLILLCPLKLIFFQISSASDSVGQTFWGIVPELQTVFGGIISSVWNLSLLTPCLRFSVDILISLMVWRLAVRLVCLLRLPWTEHKTRLYFTVWIIEFLSRATIELFSAVDYAFCYVGTWDARVEVTSSKRQQELSSSRLRKTNQEMNLIWTQVLPLRLCLLGALIILILVLAYRLWLLCLRLCLESLCWGGGGGGL